MRAYEFLTEGRDATVYHGINKIKYAIMALKDNIYENKLHDIERKR